jgi:hypothetical protein
MTTFYVPSNIIGVAGDWHGETGWAKQALTAFHKENVQHIFQLGDFGIWGGNDGGIYIRKINKWLEENNQTLYVTLGNHEDYVRVENTPIAEDGTQWYHNNERIKLLPRGFRGTVGSPNKTWVSLGGANSIDYKNRKEWVSWWRAESITQADVYRTAEGGKAYYMFCHDAPTGVPFEYESKSYIAGWDEDEVRYSNDSRKMLKYAVDAVQPEILFHGHHHVFQDVTVNLKTEISEASYSLRSVGLARDTIPNNLIVFNVQDDSYYPVTV